MRVRPKPTVQSVKLANPRPLPHLCSPIPGTLSCVVHRIEIFPGAFHVPGFLTLDEQRPLLARCRELGAGPAGLYVPTVRGGGKMHLQMLCLGMHWNARTYRYEPVRADADGLPPPPLPADFIRLAKRAAVAVGMAIEPQVCIVNFYGPQGKLGVHQDKDERPETLAAGIPIVSISIGDTARFVVGGTRRKEAMTPIFLESGDAFIMGGLSRLRYHGVTGIRAGTAPAELGLEGRFNLTFRQYSLIGDPGSGVGDQGAPAAAAECEHTRQPRVGVGPHKL